MNAGNTCPPASNAAGGSSSTIDGVPVGTIDLTLPPVPNDLSQIGGTCPVGQNYNQGAVITSNATTSKNYLRANAAGTAVELCTVDSSLNTIANQAGEMQLSPSITNCSTSGIDEFCVKSAINGVESFNCRITSMRACDNTSATPTNGVCGTDRGNNLYGGGQSEANRVNNNSFITDSTRMPINLFFNEQWKPSEATTITYSTCNSSPANSPPPVNCSDRTEAVITSTKRINLVGGFDDGHFQHVSCPPALPPCLPTKPAP